MKKDQTVLQAKRFEVHTCHQHDRLLLAARRMVEEGISTLVVVDNAGWLAGIITRTDLLRALCEHEDWKKQPVEAYMNRQVVTAQPHTPLREVAQYLLDHQIHRVVIVNSEQGRQRPLAVISAADLIYHMTSEN